MKLYFKAGACSLAPHIVLSELGLVYERESVDLAKKSTEHGDDYWKINPKGSVPALRLDNGEILTEVAVICQYLADQKPEANLLPKTGTMERYRCMEWLNFIATEIHKGMGPFFFVQRMTKDESAQNDIKNFSREGVERKLGLVSERLGSNDYLLGKQFTVADAYLFTVMGWYKHAGIELNKWSNLAAYLKRVGERPGVIKAMKEEGLI